MIRTEKEKTSEQFSGSKSIEPTNIQFVLKFRVKASTINYFYNDYNYD